LDTAYEREDFFALLLGNKPVILNEVKNLSWAKKRSFAGAQDDQLRGAQSLLHTVKAHAMAELAITHATSRIGHSMGANREKWKPTSIFAFRALIW
jgi:hypothetical protein